MVSAGYLGTAGDFGIAGENIFSHFTVSPLAHGVQAKIGGL